MTNKIDNANLDENLLVTVAMPVYNGAQFLTEAIESILAQSMKSFEFIVIDDGSSDASLEILKKYRDIDPRIKVFSRENRGVVFTRNELIERSAGKFIAWMDQDDISLPDRLIKQVELMERTNADICGCHWIVINEDGKFIDTRLVPLETDSFVICLAETVPFAHGSVMIRRQFAIEKSLRYGSRRYAEDYDLWIRFFEAGAYFVNVNDFLFKYRDYSTSLSKRKIQELMSDTRALKLGFMKRNSGICVDSITKLSKRTRSLSLFERVNLVIASFRLSKLTKSLLFVETIKSSNRRSVVTALFELLR